MSQDLRDFDGLTPELITTLADGGVHTRDDLADLAVDELVELAGVDEEHARALIMKAREHWFSAEEAAKPSAASEAAAEAEAQTAAQAD